jgi:hypothetical protein
MSEANPSYQLLTLRALSACRQASPGARADDPRQKYNTFAVEPNALQ